MIRTHLIAVLLIALLSPAVQSQQDDGQPFDILLTGGQVYDGSGNPWFYADVGIRGDRIAAVGDLSDATARRRIDVSGKAVAPGFIDIHSHADGPLYEDEGLRSDEPKRRSAPNLVSQGITLVVVNQDGRSPGGLTIGEQIEELRSGGTGVHVAVLKGHGALRRQVMGDDYRRTATGEEITEMRAQLREALKQGAYGMSAGLEYVPGRWSTTREVAELAKELVPYDGVYISHQRSEAKTPMMWLPSTGDPDPPTAADALEETIEIGRQSGAKVVASHIKSRGTNYWGGSEMMISLINQAREEGVRVYADQYPYNTSGSDGSVTLIPDWAFDTDRWEISEEQEGDVTVPLRRVLNDPDLRDRLYADMEHIFKYRGGAENITIFDHPVDSLVGMTVAQAADGWETDHLDAAIRIQMEGYADEEGGGRLRSFSMNEEDIKVFARQPWTATSTDGSVALPEDGPDVHARFYGTFPRKIHKYAIEEQAITVEHAVRSSTSLPAQILGLPDRGTVEAGNVADLVVMDLAELEDRATFFEPHQHSAGIDYVFVNGIPVVDAGERTGELPGEVVTPVTDR